MASMASMGLAAGVAAALAAFVGCGGLDPAKKDDAKSKDEATSDVEFSGYVQKAFTLKVNGSAFTDSEQFYTQFIDKLVKPSYPELSDKNVEVEGKYGLSEFGAGSKVYMSSMAADGHLFESTTDGQSKFTVKVTSTALDEMFKARVIIRIGLLVKKDGSEDQHSCYILHGIKENIAISESSKPIIFDDFSTQLNTYKCEDVKDNELIIPGAGGQTSTATSTSTTSGPRATVDSTQKVQATLPAKYEGGEKLTAVTFGSQGEVYYARSAVHDKDTGKYCWPVVKLSGLANPTETISCVGESADDLTIVHGLESLVQSGGSLVATRGAKLSSFAPDGSGFQTLDWSKESSLAVAVDGAIKAVFGSQSGTVRVNEVCDLTMVAAEPASSCANGPNNKCDLGLPQTYAYHAGAIMAANGINSQGSGYCGATAIHAVSKSLSYIKSYPVSALEIPVDEFAASKLASYDNQLYLFSLVGSELRVRKMKLAE